MQAVVEPQLAHFQWGEAPVPLPAWTGARARFDILDDEARDWEEPTQERSEPEFPLPASLGGGRNFLACVMAVRTGLAARRLTMAACPAHAGALLFGDLDACARLSLDVQISMRCRDRAIALAFAPWIDANGDGLRCAGRGLDVEAHAEEACLPEAGALPLLSQRRARAGVVGINGCWC